MSARNIAFKMCTCPRCGSLREIGFELDVGDSLNQRLDPGDLLDSTEPLPQGRWVADGLGVCYKCGQTIEANVHFDGNVFIDVTDLRPREAPGPPVHKVVFKPYPCPRCGLSANSGFEIDEGDRVPQFLHPGDRLVSTSKALPSGRWVTGGSGWCYACGTMTEGNVQFDGDVFVDVTDIRPAVGPAT
jgi:hypothetical protein